MLLSLSFFFFFFNDTATTEIYTLSLHDALPIYADDGADREGGHVVRTAGPTHQQEDQAGEKQGRHRHPISDRKSTRLNSSHLVISYAVFCLKKKKKKTILR